MKKLAFLLVACILALGLTACGTSNTSTSTNSTATTSKSNSSQAISASEAFNTESIWYVTSKTIGKDSPISRIVVFDGKGNCTSYETSGMQLGDLNGKSDEQIIEMAKQADKENFESNRESQLKNDYSDSIKSKIQAAQYVAPENAPFELSIETDRTGNSTKTETIEYDGRTFFEPYVLEEEGSSDGVIGLKIGRDKDLESLGNWTGEVYDMHFGGFKGFVTRLGNVSDSYAGYTVDQPGTAGIAVDEK